MTLIWAAWGQTAHVIDEGRKVAKRSGPLTLCKRYPGRYEHPWWSWPVATAPERLSYDIKKCVDCEEAL